MGNIESKLKGNTFIEKLIIENIKNDNENLYSFFESDLPIINKNWEKGKKDNSLEEEQVKFLLNGISQDWKISDKRLDRQCFLAGICRVAKENNCTNDLVLMLTGSFDMEDYVGR